MVSGICLFTGNWTDSKSLCGHIRNVLGDGVVACGFLALGSVGSLSLCCAGCPFEMETRWTLLGFSKHRALESHLVAVVDAISGTDQ